MVLVSGPGCAVIIPPGGGPRDSLPPQLVSANPKDSALNFKTNRIVLTFDEFVQLDQAYTEQLVVSPMPVNPPNIEGRLRTVSIKLRDSLEANTTYSINFGNSIKDVNEGTPFKNFTYVFSTGDKLDENGFGGKVILAENGKVDSTLIVVLHNNLNDTAVEKLRPRYFTRLDGKGNFRFRFLPSDTFNVFVLPNDYSKTYDDSTKMFAFINRPVFVNDTTGDVTLYAYQEEKEKPRPAATSSGNNQKKDKDQEQEDKRLKFTTNLSGNEQGLLDSLKFTFSRKLSTYDSTQIQLTDTNYTALGGVSFSLDTGRTKLTLAYAWPENTPFKLILAKTAVADSAGVNLPKADTLSFTTKRESDYGSIFLRFNNIDLAKNPVLQVMKGEELFQTIILTGKEWRQRLYEPGEYEMRILFDDNKNGKWDPGNYKLKKQPELVQTIPKKLSIRANWDNEDQLNF